MAKIFERLIYNKFLDFFLLNNIISKKQFGFLKNVGTKDALNYITNLLYNSLDSSKPSIVTFLDLAKAFDTVDHTLLLEKLYRYGIRGTAHNLIESYLSNRLQRVKIGSVVSDCNLVVTGVPQGTILGPLLFLLYVNDLLTSMEDCIIISYADDTATVSIANTWHEAANKMNKQLEHVSKWLKFNKLSVNVDKTVYMTFGNYIDSVPIKCDIFMDDIRINRVNSVKYLGIIFDFNLRWDKHIEYLVSKTKYLIFIFYKLAQFIEPKTLNMVYHALFHSIASYGIIAWGGAYSNCLDVLQKIQSKIIKIINKNNLEQLNTPLNLKQQFSFDAIMYHYQDLRKQYINSQSITRNKSIMLPILHKRVSDKNSLIIAIKIFNRLPDELKKLNGSREFRKNKMKKWIKENT